MFEIDKDGSIAEIYIIQFVNKLGFFDFFSDIRCDVEVRVTYLDDRGAVLSFWRMEFRLDMSGRIVVLIVYTAYVGT
jgi:hypothetical protein